MRFDRGSTRSSPSLDPIHIEFYGSDGPGPRPATDPPDDAVPSGGCLGRVIALVVAVGLVIAIAVVAATVALDRADGGAAGRASTDVAAAADATVPEVAPLERLPSFEWLASTLPFPGGAVPPGRYVTDLLGLPIEFTIGEGTALRTARQGTIVLAPVGTAANDLGGTPHIQFIRLAGWNTRAEAADQQFRGVGGIAPDDIEGWIANNDLIVVRRARMGIDGRDTRVFDVRVHPTSPLGSGVCLPESRPCFWFASVAAEAIPHAAVRLDNALFGSMTMRMWLVTIPGEDPVLVEAAVPTGFEPWLDEFEKTTMETLVIGETALELLGGIGSGIPAPP